MALRAPGIKKEHQVYADLMDEARVRIHAIRDAIAQRTLWAPRLLQEFVYLQLRMLCETIAVGCLVAHGEVKDKQLLKRWHVAEILDRMDGLNIDFYPRGVRFVRQPDGSLHLADHNVPQLSRSELRTLWERSGRYLHRGSAKSLVAEQGNILNVNLDPVILAAQKILNLLEQHIISSGDKQWHLLAALASEDSGGKASVWYAGPRGSSPS